MRRIAVLVVPILLALSTAADARRPVVVYADGTNSMRFFDAETGTDTAGPPFPASLSYSLRRVTTSHNGRFVVWQVGPIASGKVHLYDREPGLERRLPGVGTGAFVTTTNSGRYVAWDAGSNPPVKVYDRQLGRVLTEPELGLPQNVGNTANKLRQPVFSGDGTHIVGTEFGCAGGSDSDTCLYQFQGANTGLPNVTGDDEDPCVNGDGLKVAVTAPDPTKHDLFSIDRSLVSPAWEKPPGTPTAVANERFCFMDSTGDYIAYQDFDTGTMSLYEAATDSLVPLPAGVAAGSLAGLIDPYTPPAPTGPRKPVVGYLTAGGVVQLWDARFETHLTPPAVTIPDSGFGRRWSMSHNGRYIVFVDATYGLHLFDRETGTEVALPGIDQFTNSGNSGTRPGSVTVSDSGRIAFDANGNGPTRVYGNGAFLTTGPPAAHKRPRISGDGRYLATVCSGGPPGCATALGSDDSPYLHDLQTGLDTGLPENPSLTDRDEGLPCVDGDGSLVGYHVSQTGANARDIQLYDRAAAAYVALPPGVMDLVTTPNSNDWNCRLDASGDWLGFEDANFDFHVYSRQGDGFLLLPPGAAAPASPVWLSGPYPPEPEPVVPGPDNGGPGDGAPAGQTTPTGTTTGGSTQPLKLVLRLQAKALQRLARRRPSVVVTARCNQACRLRATGTASVPGTRALKLKRASGVLKRAGSVKIRLAVPAKAAAAIRRALRKKKRIPVTVVVSAVGTKTAARKKFAVRR